MVEFKPMKKLSLYIHIPFCKTICLYCNFPTFAHKNKWIPEYVDKVVDEIVEKSKVYTGCLIETIYFGGGTPSLIDQKFIQKILTSIKENFKVQKKPDISVECNPESINKE